MRLSRRFESYVHALTPKIEASLQDKANPALIDLALAENHLLDVELLEKYSEVLSSCMTAEVRTVAACRVFRTRENTN